MDCFTPGRVLLLPGPGFREEEQESISDVIRMPFSFDYSVRDVLRSLDLPGRLEEKGIDLHGLPVRAKVPEGEEREAAARLIRAGLAKAACPDYLVWPTAAVQIDQQALSRAISVINAVPNPADGAGCTVAVLDSGVDPSLLPNQASVDQTQYDVLDPSNRTLPLGDSAGHGTVVACIVNSISPETRIVSIRVFDKVGSLIGVVAGLYVCVAVGPCEIVNMSFSLDCRPAKCRNCGNVWPQTSSEAQLRMFFERFFADSPDTVAIAAAGNGYDAVAMPASFPRVIAVGEFDYRRGRPSLRSDLYKSVPQDRYILAPGRDPMNAALATQPGFGRPEPLSGTSFAAAFVSGVAARRIAAMTASGSYAQSVQAIGAFETIRASLKADADTTAPRYKSSLWGLGTLRLV